MGGGPGTVPARPMASPVQVLSQGNPNPAAGSRTRATGNFWLVNEQNVQHFSQRLTDAIQVG